MTRIKLIDTDFYPRNLQNLRAVNSDNYQDVQKSSATDCRIKKIKMEVNLFNQWQKKNCANSCSPWQKNNQRKPV
ncbi:hypothetical protein D0817_20750 [Flavobacterium cupreum]|uniref:Uncharacterized protein n=1 Tax=Flavobacterium cupreum TaxID=2133766 RepID=A0A434A2L4_9FLAO|nr:hypothetical protein D0817_20750 [Flavobacterium cupreum]